MELEISDDFPAGGDALITESHKYMVNAAKPEVLRVLDKIIKEGKHNDTIAELVNLMALPDAPVAHDTELPQTSALAGIMENSGWVNLGRVKFDRDGQEVSTTNIRRYLKLRKGDDDLGGL